MARGVRSASEPLWVAERGGAGQVHNPGSPEVPGSCDSWYGRRVAKTVLLKLWFTRAELCGAFRDRVCSYKLRILDLLSSHN